MTHTCGDSFNIKRIKSNPNSFNEVAHAKAKLCPTVARAAN